MSSNILLQFADAMDAPELQVWNNAAFDNEDSDGRWSSCLEPDLAFVNRSSESDFAGKENLSPGISVSVSAKASVPAKPLRPNAAILNSQPRPQRPKDEELEDDEKRIDSEIDAIEKEIGRLSTRLEALRIERKSKAAERRGKIVAAKFLDPTPGKKIAGEAPRSVNRRGLSLGPSEILARAGIDRLSKIEVTPIQSAQNRRKSCFWKLQEVDELRATKERGKSQSLSPKSRKTAAKTQPPKQPATTVTAKKSVAVIKEEASIAATIQPKKLFGGEKSAAKKPVRPGRVVASRYNCSATRASNEARKRSLPEEEEEVKRSEKKRMSLAASAAGKSGGAGIRGKKKWEIPSEVVVFRGSSEAEEEVAALPKIRTLRWRAEESPVRDSGPAKRVAELVGRKSYFCPDQDESVCQVLSFGEEEEELKRV